MLSLERLKHLLEYNPETGEFKWLHPPTNRTQVGSVAGSLFKDGYRIGVDGKTYRLHRLAWFYHHGVWPEYNIDHINGDFYDNRIVNLRDVPQSENLKNLSKRCDNDSGHVGVSYCNSRYLYKAVIGVNGKTKTLGRFKTIEEAISARKQAEINYGYHENHGR